MDQDALKLQAAEAAIAEVEVGMVVGVGTGSTVNHFIDLLGKLRGRIDGAVSSSEASTARLKALGIPVLSLAAAGPLPLYVDGADEANAHLELIKGGGGALTREKIVAADSERFICIVDESKLVERLGQFPLPVEVIPMARSLVARAMVKLGGDPEWREDFLTDNGNSILDVHNLEIQVPRQMEATIGAMTGVVTVGLFAQRPADLLLVASQSGVRSLKPS